MVAIIDRHGTAAQVGAGGFERHCGSPSTRPPVLDGVMSSDDCVSEFSDELVYIWCYYPNLASSKPIGLRSLQLSIAERLDAHHAVQNESCGDNSDQDLFGSYAKDSPRRSI